MCGISRSTRGLVFPKDVGVFFLSRSDPLGGEFTVLCCTDWISRYRRTAFAPEFGICQDLPARKAVIMMIGRR
jgi:hypothetical protein